jgi:AbrB family looped-hinge helix DNA binding protein
VIEAEVTAKGQVTLPVELRDRLGIGPGDHIVFVEQADGRFALRVRSNTPAGLRSTSRCAGGSRKPDRALRAKPARDRLGQHHHPAELAD